MTLPLPQRTACVRAALLGVALLCLGIQPGAAQTQPPHAFDAAYGAAQAAEQRAAAVGNRWTTTEQTLKQAREAADAGQMEDAISLAHAAQALAEASVRQAKEQKTAWRAEAGLVN